MPLSYEKLEGLLSTKGMIPKRVYASGGLCIYIEIMCVSSADSYLLYIPSKYEISAPNADHVYDIHFLEVDEDGSIPRDYAGDPDNIDLEEQYNPIEVGGVPVLGEDERIEDKLEESYNHPVSLRDMTKKDMGELRDVFRQLRRLRLCVQGLKYKIAIVFRNFMCCIRRDDTFEAFSIHTENRTPSRRMIMICDLETFYDKIETISTDVCTVRDGIYRVLDKNQLKHTRNLGLMLQQREQFAKNSDVVYAQKAKYSAYLAELQKMLADLSVSEQKIVEKLHAVNENGGREEGIKGLHSDVQLSHQTAQLEGELTRLNGVKQKIIVNILDIKDKLERISLTADSILFDVTVMIDAIVRNYRSMSDLCK